MENTLMMYLKLRRTKLSCLFIKKEMELAELPEAKNCGLKSEKKIIFAGR